jgi:hypothetical protein
MRGILRILNTMFWCWIALSNVFAPISTSEDFWIERAQMLFQVGPVDNAFSLMLRASIPTFLWLFFDWVIRDVRAGEISNRRAEEPGPSAAVRAPKRKRRSLEYHEASPPPLPHEPEGIGRLGSEESTRSRSFGSRTGW